MSRALTVLFTLCFFHLLPLQAAPALASLFPQEQQQEQQQYQQQDQGPAYENFSRDQLDNLLSPVALYPDPLLAQLFVAATFPDQVEEAARFVRGNGPNGVDEQDWDVSVRAIAHYPTVIGMMADKIDWTTSLGQAYVNSPQTWHSRCNTCGAWRAAQEICSRRSNRKSWNTTTTSPSLPTSRNISTFPSMIRESFTIAGRTTGQPSPLASDFLSAPG